MPKSNIALRLNKPEYTGMVILELSKVLMYEFHCDYIKNKYDHKSKLLFTESDVWNDTNVSLCMNCMKLKLRMSMRSLSAVERCLISVIN